MVHQSLLLCGAPPALPGLTATAGSAKTDLRHLPKRPARLTTNTSPLVPSFSTTYQGSRKPPILALWPKVYRNQPTEIMASQGAGTSSISNAIPLLTGSRAWGAGGSSREATEEYPEGLCAPTASLGPDLVWARSGCTSHPARSHASCRAT